MSKILKIGIIILLLSLILIIIILPIISPPEADSIILYTDLSDQQLKPIVEVINSSIVDRKIPFTIEKPSNPKVSVESMVIASIVKGYITKPKTAILFTTSCGSDLASYIALSVWGSDDFVQFNKYSDQLLDPVKQACTIMGHLKDLNKDLNDLFVVPVVVYRTNIIYINLEVINKYNLTVPSTIDELIKTCVNLKNNGIACFALPGFNPRKLNNNDPMILTFLDDILLATLGPQKYRDLYLGLINISDPLLKKALDLFVNLSGYITPGWRQMNIEGAINYFLNGNAAFLIGGGWLMPLIYGKIDENSLCTINDVKPSCKVLVAPFPSTNDVYSMSIIGMGLVNNDVSKSVSDVLESIVKNNIEIVNKLYGVSPYKEYDSNLYATAFQKWDYYELITKNYVLSLSQGGLWTSSSIDFLSSTVGLVDYSIKYINKQVPIFVLNRNKMSWISTINSQLKQQYDAWTKYGLSLEIYNK
ncbi:MAG: extracellular solute-binding protein [Staphylothermus sp.]|nr:extracellular solute-binding protein [Staphylothermus sp.]